MITADDSKFVVIQRRNGMKKLMTLMLGLAFLTGTVSVAFSQDAPKKESKKKGKKKKGEEPKKETR